MIFQKNKTIMRSLYFLSFACCIVIFTSAHSQLKKKTYGIKIEILNGGVVKGHLLALGDSSIEVSLGTKGSDTVFFVHDIKKISLRRIGAPGRGFATGLTLGMGTGFILGYATHSRPDCTNGFICPDLGPGFSGLAGALVGGVAGGVIGVSAGFGYKHFFIDGNRSSYHVLRRKILNGPKSTLEKKSSKAII